MKMQIKSKLLLYKLFARKAKGWIIVIFNLCKWSCGELDANANSISHCHKNVYLQICISID